MSTRHIPYPADFEINHDAAIEEERHRRALKSLEVGDVLAQIADLMSQEPDPAKHPCCAMVAWMLDQRLEPGHGGQFWDAWKVLAWQAIDRLVEARLQGGGLGHVRSPAPSHSAPAQGQGQSHRPLRYRL
jgi:hypothetical protein